MFFEGFTFSCFLLLLCFLRPQKLPRNTSKTPPRPLIIDPRWLQNLPACSQDAPQANQNSRKLVYKFSMVAKMLPRGPKRPQEGLQDTPKRPQHMPRMPQCAPQDASKCLQDARRCPQYAPRCSKRPHTTLKMQQMSPKMPKNAAKMSQNASRCSKMPVKWMAHRRCRGTVAARRST